MTFTEIVNTVAARLDLTSATALARIGVTVNDYYAQIVTAIGLNTSVRTTCYGVVAPGSPLVEFAGVQKVTGVFMPGDTQDRVLSEVLFPDMRDSSHPTGDLPSKYAIYQVGARSVTIRIDVVPITAFQLVADAVIEQSALSGSMEPAFPASFHDVLIHGVMMDELRKMEKTSLAQDRQNLYEQRLADLKYFLAKSAYLNVHAGLPRVTGPVTGGAFVSPSGIGPSAWWINVLDYGAVGNGVTDDTTAINTAMAALPVTGGGVLIFPAGKTFRMTAPLNIAKPLMMWGCGNGSWTSLAQGSSIFFDGCSGLVTTAHTAERCRISNIRIYGDDTVGTIGVHWSSHALHMDGVQVQHFGLVNISIDTESGGNANNCYLEKVAVSFSLVGIAIVGGNSNVCTLISPEVQSCTSGYYITSSNTVILNPLEEGSDTIAYYIGGSSNFLSQPYSEGNKAIFFPGSGGSQSSNNLVLNSFFGGAISGDTSANYIFNTGGWNNLRIGGSTATDDADLFWKVNASGMIFDGQNRMNHFRVGTFDWAINATIAHGTSVMTSVTKAGVSGDGTWDARVTANGGGVDFADGWQLSCQPTTDAVKVVLTNVSGSSKAINGTVHLRVVCIGFNSLNS